MGQSYATGQAQSPYGQYQASSEASPKKRVGLWVTAGIGVVVLALVIYAAVNIFKLASIDPLEDPDPGVGVPTTAMCPERKFDLERREHPIDGRVYGGSLSYPMLGSPWSKVRTLETRLPFGRDIADQVIVIHEDYEPYSDWVTSVLVGELYAGDGFYNPEKGSEIVNKCIIGGGFYGENNLITSEVLVSERFDIDGYPGWITKTNLSFEIPNLPTTSELSIVIIVKTSEMSSSIFYASIPNDAMEYLPDIERAIEELQVTPS
jgi:hypothetical protein